MVNHKHKSWLLAGRRYPLFSKETNSSALFGIHNSYLRQIDLRRTRHPALAWGYKPESLMILCPLAAPRCGVDWDTCPVPAAWAAYRERRDAREERDALEGRGVPCPRSARCSAWCGSRPRLGSLRWGKGKGRDEERVMKWLIGLVVSVTGICHRWGQLGVHRRAWTWSRALFLTRAYTLELHSPDRAGVVTAWPAGPEGIQSWAITCIHADQQPLGNWGADLGWKNISWMPKPLQADAGCGCFSMWAPAGKLAEE